MSQKYEKLKALLKELFQLDQPDLDFGLYRVMHAKAAEVTEFLDKDLLPQVKEAFSLYKTADKAELEKELAKVVGGVQAAGMDPEQSPKVRELRAKLASDAVDLTALQNEVYDHLFSFFRRYYSEGDFLAKRVYKPGVYAIPYEGEEVKLHWANRDQYYIKTSEYLRDYAFRLRPDNDKNPMRVHFRLADAAEGEHGDVKAAEGKDRVFILAAPGESGRDFAAEDDGEQGKELILRFEYRPATLTDWPAAARGGKTKPPTQKDLIALAEQRVLAMSEEPLASWIAELGKPHVKADGERAEYTRLRAHLNRYTGRYTFDYFIHKDLGGFLRRELDFYIKNEVMHLDDVENETAPRVDQYLSKIRVLRRIAGKIIAFLTQLEDFQKKLWVKKKFVAEMNYCVTLDQVPEVLYPEIAANDAQRTEWVDLFAIHTIEKDLHSPGYSEPLTVEFLKANVSLVVDTSHFPRSFCEKLLASFNNLDAGTSGVLVHSDNFHGLTLVRERLKERVRCFYIDPPYNTGSDDFAYKDAYQHSSWISLLRDRCAIAASLLCSDGAAAIHINDIEHWRLRGLCEDVFRPDSYITTVTTQCATASSFKTVNLGPTEVTDHVLLFAKSKPDFSYTPQYIARDEVDLVHFSRFVVNKDAAPAEWQFRPVKAQVLQEMGFPGETTQQSMKLAKESLGDDAEIIVRKKCQEFALSNADRVFDSKLFQKPSPWLKEHIDRSRDLDHVIEVVRDDLPSILLYKGRQVYFLSNNFREVNGVRRLAQSLSNLWIDLDTNNLVYEGDVPFPAGKKPLMLIRRLIGISDQSEGEYVLDFFAGSGTVGHAVLDMNDVDGGNRKFCLMEMGSYFDSATLPRIKKAVYTTEWKKGSPGKLRGKPHRFKYIRLESYEDALNNLATRHSKVQRSLLDTAEAQGADKLRERYILRYMLDVETRGSQSLLNVQAFTDPTAYKLKVKRPGSDESREVNVDLLETFNWLIGLTVRHIATPQTFSAGFERDSEKRLRLKRRIKEDDAGPYWFRTVTGTTPDGRKTLIIWRKRPGGEMPDGIEQDNLVLDEWFTRQRYSSKDSEFDLIYVNGSNNLENLKAPDDTWKVRLIEEDFHRLMFETEGE